MNSLFLLAAMFSLFSLFSCTSDIELPPPPPENPSSNSLGGDESSSSSGVLSSSSVVLGSSSSISSSSVSSSSVAQSSSSVGQGGGPSNTPCGGKIVYIKLPDGWGNSTYFTWEGPIRVIIGTKEGVWTKFTIPTNLGNDNLGSKAEIIFLDYNDYYNSNGIHYVTRNAIGEGSAFLSGSGDRFKCSDFGEVTYIMEDPDNPGKPLLTY